MLNATLRALKSNLKRHSLKATLTRPHTPAHVNSALAGSSPAESSASMPELGDMSCCDSSRRAKSRTGLRGPLHGRPPPRTSGRIGTRILDKSRTGNATLNIRSTTNEYPACRAPFSLVPPRLILRNGEPQSPPLIDAPESSTFAADCESPRGLGIWDFASARRVVIPKWPPQLSGTSPLGHATASHSAELNCQRSC